MPKFTLGQRVTKISGSSWTGLIVGTYSSSLTPEGYVVESENEPGSCQLYPASALQLTGKPQDTSLGIGGSGGALFIRGSYEAISKARGLIEDGIAYRALKKERTGESSS